MPDAPNPPLNDPDLEHEISLLSEAIVAAAGCAGHLSDDEIDAALGVARRDRESRDDGHSQQP
ncbi:hypothetical protein ACFUC1_05355 [Pedococcus sp. NPDC057267]|uniref:hypothetical protein n=1 Tax=Pedococcus sp. NPDC057267 TaxID=3346077 RepID=UPI00362D3980